MPSIAAAQASDDPAATQAAIVAYTNWEGIAQALGAEDRIAAQTLRARAGLAKAIVHGRKAAYDRCTKQKELGAVTLILRFEMFSQATGIAEDGVGKQLAEKCTTFRLDFDSQLQGHSSFAGFSGSGTHHLSGAITIHVLDLVAGVPQTGPLNYVSVSASSSGSMGDMSCTGQTTGGQGSTMSVSAVDLGLNFGTTKTSPADLSLTLDPGTPTENWMAQCSSPAGSQSMPMTSNDWHSIWTLLHSGDDASQAGDGPWTFTNWSPTSGATYATKTMTPQADIGIYGGSETLVLNLVHTPEG
jgi:hypothetical protein